MFCQSECTCLHLTVDMVFFCLNIMKIHTQRESTRTIVSTCHSNKKRCKRCIRTKMIKRHIVLVKVSKVDKTGRTTACVKGCTDTK